MDIVLKRIAKIKTPFKEKFGIPRQSGLCKNIFGTIVFEEDYRDENMLRELETYSHLWILWGFSEAFEKGWSATVRPPKLGGNTRVGVFASRSPFRPNPIALSVVKIEEIKKTVENGTVIVVSGVDMLNDSPIYDIKPYVAYSDSIENAVSGFAVSGENFKDVVFECNIEKNLETKLREILSRDPRPMYHDDESRIYKMTFENFDIAFSVNENTVFVKSVTQQI